LTATAISASQINLTWTDNSANETGFIVGRSTVSGGPYTDVAGLVANSTSYSDSGLAANTTYYYVVRATGSGGDSANSAQASATTLGTAPNAPSGLTATAASSTQINLSWTDNSSNETGFRVEKSTDNVNFTQFVSLSANVTSTSATGLNGSTTYYFRVRAYNASGNSA
jgi:predicted phage tail protein